jgi:hypothetical protein
VLRKMMMLAAILAVVLVAAAPALASSRSPNDSAKGNPGKGNSGHNKDFAGLVDIGGGRKMYMECQGKGSPTVVFVSGGRGPHRNVEHNVRQIQAGGVTRDRRNESGVRLRPPRDFSRDW